MEQDKLIRLFEKHAESDSENFKKIGESLVRIEEKAIQANTSHEQTNKHLEELNGKVSRNSKFRERLMGGIAVIAFLGFTSLVAWVVLIGKTL